MNFVIKIISLFLFIIILSNCNEKIIHSGKVFNENIKFKEILNKNELIKIMGLPNYIDPITNNYFYIGQKAHSKNFYNVKIKERKIILFEFDKNDKIINFKSFDLENSNNVIKNKDRTEDKLLERGLIEKIFGGIGKSSIPIPQNN